jgi:hypothetical protein
MFASFVLFVLYSYSAHAQECPKAPQQFAVERNRATVEVLFPDDHLVRTIYRLSNGETLLETTEFEGLFELERIDHGRRSVYRPQTTLASLLPLRVGKKITAEFESGDAPHGAREKINLKVTRSDALYIGECKYSVLVIDRSVGSGASAPAFVRTDYYAPDLKLIIAKEFKEGNGASDLNKYDRIYPMKH